MTQDDAREKELIRLFDLQEPVPKTRGGLDAYLDLDGHRFDFEIKSCTNKSGSVSTARDVGADHIKRWRKFHWIFGFYANAKLVHCAYASPDQIAVWLDELEAYIRPDVELCKLMEKASKHITVEDLYRILGKKSVYGMDEARHVHKRSLSAAEYQELVDAEGGYSPDRMVEMLSMRTKYILARGATLNNPHIKPAFFAGLPTATTNHSAALRRWLRGWARGRMPVVRPIAPTVELRNAADSRGE